MKHKTLFTIGTLMIIGGLAASFLTSYAKEVSQTKQNSVEIQAKYLEFKDILTILNGERENLYNDVINELSVETIEKKYNSWLETYKEYEKIIEKINGYKNFIKEKCFKINYTDSNIQSKCDSLMLSYETAINYYVKDVNKFNDIVKNYNGELDEKKQKELIKLNEYNYIDFNDDGRYTGK